jgi:type I restriction enzyme S subunit
MARDWEHLILGDLGRIVTGKTPLTAVEGNFGGQVPFVTPSDMDGRRTISITARYLTEVGATSVKGSRIPAGSVMVSCIGSDMRKAVIAGRDCVTNQQINSIVVDDRFSSEFVYYNLSTRKSELRHQAAGGSAQPILNKGDFSRIQITLPPLAEQKAIAAVLGALDDKIELNRRMNATLEAMARALFQSWFVGFDAVHAKREGRQPAGLDAKTAALFPATSQDSPLGPIPQGWEATNLEAIASVGSGKRPTGRNDVLSPECNIPLYGGGGRMGYVPSPLYERPILFTGRVGTLGLIFRTSEPSWPSDNTLVVEPQDGFFDFAYFVLKGFDLIMLNRGSTQPLLTQTDVKRQQFVLPPKPIVKAFAEISVPIFQQVTANEQQSRTLTTLRDTLLPKLLSGELSVAAAAKRVEARA